MSIPRISNIIYPVGSVVMIDDPDNCLGEYLKFLINRPLIVIQPQNPMFDTLMVLACGTRNRPGIEVSLMNHATGKYVSNKEHTLCLPYSCYTIRVKMIKECLGVLDPWIMEEIMKAFEYHLGRNPVPPPYMQAIHEELYAPIFNMATVENTQLHDQHAMLSKSHAASMGVVLPDEQTKKPIDHGAAYSPAPKTPKLTIPKGGHIETGKHYKEAGPQPSEKVVTPTAKTHASPVKTPTTKTPPTTTPKPTTTKPASAAKTPAASVTPRHTNPSPIIPKHTNPSPSAPMPPVMAPIPVGQIPTRKIPIAKQPEQKQPKAPNGNTQRHRIEELGDELTARIIAKDYSNISVVMGDKKRKLSSSTCSEYRKVILDMYRPRSAPFARRIDAKIRDSKDGFGALTQTEQLLALCFVDPDLVGSLKDADYRKLCVQVFRKYGISIKHKKYHDLPNHDFLCRVMFEKN